MMETKQRNLSARKLQNAAELLKCIGHPVRLQILELLAAYKSLSVSEIQNNIGTEQSLLSHHLTKMKDKGVLFNKRKGKKIYYELSDTQLTSILDCMKNVSFSERVK